MAIKKQDFYEGAAIYQLARAGVIDGLRYDAPFFVLNDKVVLLLKYCTRGRSPWGFTFTAEEQRLLSAGPPATETTIGLVCGADGVVSLSCDAYKQIASVRGSSVHIACSRHHGQHYTVSGPDGTLDKKVAPLEWRRILSNDAGGKDETP